VHDVAKAHEILSAVCCLDDFEQAPGSRKAFEFLYRPRPQVLGEVLLLEINELGCPFLDGNPDDE